MADADQKVSTSDLAGRTAPDDARRRQEQRPDAPSTDAVEEDQGDQQQRLERERRDRGNAEGAGSTRPAENGRSGAEDGDRPAALLDGQAADQLQERWTEIQVDFVDKPRDAVSRADELVAQTMQQLAARFADERNTLEEQWSSGDDVDTEDLRLALQRYRSFFQRLLSA